MNKQQLNNSLTPSIYLIYFEWSNTAGNHAGMSYLASLLGRDFKEVKLIKMISGKSKLKKALNLLYIWYIAISLRVKLKSGDQVFFMEYLARSCFQDKLAHILRILGLKNRFVGLVHLAGSHLMEIYHKESVIRKKLRFIDDCVVFGSSLSSFLKEEIGFPNVIKTFHYVDTEYYHPLQDKPSNKKPRVVCLGNIKRDFNSLKGLVERMPQVHFDICQGVLNLEAIFKEYNNVSLYGYLGEDELLYLMQKDDICLSIMYDTVGSNVITTSMATGLVLVVSDVGSIRDYCSTDMAVLCKDPKDFENALYDLSRDPEHLKEMSNKAIEKSISFSYNEFKKEFCKIFSIG